MLLGALPKDYYIKSIFRSGEQGIWLDPSDFSTLFQDSAGTTPVTAVGQPVGLALDKRLGLALGAELVTNGGFDSDTAWAKGSGWSISGGKAVRVAAGGGSTINQSAALVAGAIYRIEFDYYNVTTTGLYAALRGGVTVSGPNVSLTSASGRYSCFIRAVSGNNTFDISCSDPATSGSFDNFTIRELPGNHAYQTTSASRPTLQQDSNGLYYLSFDGTDDGMATPSIDFTGTDKMTVWAGVRKNSDAAAGILAELSTNSDSTNGTFNLAASVSGNNYYTQSRGTVRSAKYATGYVAPISNILTGIGDISGDACSLRVNGTTVTAATDQGTGNYGNYPLYIGRRGGTTLPFNGRIYQLIIRGAASNDGQIAATEAWCNSKTRAY